MAGALAHELNNIFTAVVGNLSFLEEDVKGQNASKILDDVRRTALRGMELSQRLQKFAGRQPLQRTRLDLNTEVIRVITELKRNVLQRFDLKLQLEGQECPVFSDKSQLHQVLEEIFKNAAAAMPPGEVLRISSANVVLKSREVASLAAGPYVKLTVRDRGHGMTSEIVSRAAEPFFSTKSKSADMGWGLSTAVGFAQQSGGTLILSSVPELGTQVEIYLPAIN